MLKQEKESISAVEMVPVLSKRKQNVLAKKKKQLFAIPSNGVPEKAKRGR